MICHEIQNTEEQIMSRLQTPFRHDYVGSFLRPEKLKKARKAYEDGQITRDALTETENECIRELVAKQKELGYRVITDGEFRRATWHLDFMWGFDGIGHKPTETGLPFHGEQAMIDDTFLTGKLSLNGEHPFVEHFRFVKALEDGNTVAKQTIPAPAQFLAQLIMPFAVRNTRKYYATDAEVAADLVAGYQEVIRQLYEAGCRNLQLDDCTWGMLVDPNVARFYGADGGVDRIKEKYLEINNRVIEGAPEDLVINTHVCRGNFHSTYANSGAYNGVAEYLFARENVNAFYLEFDDERSGGFDPLAKVAGDKKVVLGLITTKSPKLEDKQQVIARIREAEKYLPLDRLCLSPQCGFASCEIGNKLTEEEQWAKLRLVKEIADEVWG